MRLLGAFSVGGSAPTPLGFSAFFPPEWALFALFQGDRLNPSPAFPAAEPVARVASQHCPIPSGSGRLIINRVARALNEKAANGKYPLNFVSHILAHRRSSALAAQRGGNGRTMKTTSRGKLNTGSSRGLQPEYRFDYTKAKPNRFAKQIEPGSVAVMLDPDVAQVFKNSESVNVLLRAILAKVPDRSRR